METTTTRTIQTRNAAGNWNDASDFGGIPENRITDAMAHNGLTREQVMSELEAGKSLRFGNDWYEAVRLEPIAVQEPSVTLVACKCGHSVPRAQVMNASMGTSCPRCYDRMSE